MKPRDCWRKPTLRYMQPRAKEEERPQSKKGITVGCIDFCEVTTEKVQRPPPDLRRRTFCTAPGCSGGNSLFPRKPTQLLINTLCCHVPGPSRCTHATTCVVHMNQEAQELLDEIQQQPGVLVLSGPAAAITNVVTASEFLADGWSTESVSRVVRAARTKQENYGKEHAEHAYYNYIQDETYDFRHLSNHSSGDSTKVNKPTENCNNQKMTRTMKQNNHYPTHCKYQETRLESMRTWSIHQTAHWYACYAVVEPSADSFWQPPNTVVVRFKHRNAQLVPS